VNTTTIRKSVITVAALGALGLGGSALADAANNSSSARRAPQSRPQREALSADVAAKVKVAALDEVAGAAVLRTEAGGPYNAPYHAHIKTADGQRRVVLVDDQFEATDVVADRSRGGRRAPHGHGHGPGRDHGPEAALTGEAKQKVEEAVLAEYPDATIVRTETNTDGSAPYESHITTTGGRDLEVLVNEDFEVVGAREHPARP
jgi:hypothetical protein